MNEQLEQWLQEKKITLQPFQREVAQALKEKKEGLVTAPTGSGKSLSLWLPALENTLSFEASTRISKKPPEGLRVLWISPLRALANDLAQALAAPLSAVWEKARVEFRTGDTSTKNRKRQLTHPPYGLVTTPESLHHLLAEKDHALLFQNLELIVADEWHELLGSKRGVMLELAIAHLKLLAPKVLVWGLSATVANVSRAASVLLPWNPHPTFVSTSGKKKLSVKTLLPERMERFPWAGHLGLRQLPQVVELLKRSQTSIIFTNTRSFTESWYQALLEAEPDFAGQIATHHGSLDEKVRRWVEAALSESKLKAVVATSSLDLGVDFSTVDQVIQLGSPKSISRLLQRAGRSGHRPDAESKLTFVPTNALELIELAALRAGLEAGELEESKPVEMPVDLLVQYLCTRALGDGFIGSELKSEVRKTCAFQNLDDATWEWALSFVTRGGEVLAAYDEYHKVEERNGRYVIADPAKARRQKWAIGVITADPAVQVKFLRGGYVGTVEEHFASKLKKGDTFWLGGKCLEFHSLEDMTLRVRKSAKLSGLVPRWMGGRIPLSVHAAHHLRLVLEQWESSARPEIVHARPILEVQKRWSAVPGEKLFLIERLKSREGYHLFFYPVDGRALHESLSLLIAYRISRWTPITFSISMNDYGFELLARERVDDSVLRDPRIWTIENLERDLRACVNESESVKRQFREIARVAGLVFEGYPGHRKTAKHLQANTGLIFEVFRKYDPGNPLLKQAERETLVRTLDIERITATLKRCGDPAHFTIKDLERPSPFCFPLIVDRLREKLSSQSLEKRIQAMVTALEEAASKDEREK